MSYLDNVETKANIETTIPEIKIPDGFKEDFNHKTFDSINQFPYQADRASKIVGLIPTNEADKDKYRILIYLTAAGDQQHALLYLFFPAYYYKVVANYLESFKEKVEIEKATYDQCQAIIEMELVTVNLAVEKLAKFLLGEADIF